MTGKLSLFFAFNFWILILAQDDPTSCPNGMDADNKKSCCTKLDEKISTVHPYTCCPYPRMVIWKWQYELCFAECELTAESSPDEIKEKRCCTLPCCFRYLKLIGSKPQIDGIDSEGLKFSFLLSVYNDTKWVDVISSAVNTCNTQLRQDIPIIANQTDPEIIKTYDNFWDCFEMIPKYLYNIIDCVYYQNFLSCPVYKEDSAMCPEWKSFIQDCVINENE